MGNREVAQLLQETLDEEGKTDKLLTQISKRLLKESGKAAAKGEGVGEKERGQTGKQNGRSGQARTKSASGRGNGSQAQSRSSAGNSKSRTSSRASGGARPLTDHDEIRQWAEDRGAQPACVKGTGSKDDTGMIRLDFPGYSGEESLQSISWDDWFEKFDERSLSLLVQDKTGRGQKSNFNKLVSRETATAAGSSRRR
jgi:hypothetical protein